MRTRSGRAASAPLVRRTGCLLSVLGQIGLDLTGRDFTSVFEPCLGVCVRLAEAMFVLIDSSGEVQDLCTLAVVEGGTALGVIHGATNLVIPVCHPPAGRDVLVLSAVIDAFGKTSARTKLKPRLLLRLRGNATPPWPNRVRIRASGELYEVELAEAWTTARTPPEPLPSGAVVN